MSYFKINKQQSDRIIKILDEASLKKWGLRKGGKNAFNSIRKLFKKELSLYISISQKRFSGSPLFQWGEE